MKAKFTLLIAAGLFISATTMAQNYNHRDDSYNYRNDSRYERHENFDYRARIFDLEKKLSFEMDQLDRARECRDWQKARFEKHQIADIRNQIHFLKSHKRFDYDSDRRF